MFLSLGKNSSASQLRIWEEEMQLGSLVRSNRRCGPDVWQFRWADRGPYGKRIYRKRVIGTVCQYPSWESAREAVRGLLREN